MSFLARSIEANSTRTALSRMSKESAIEALEERDALAESGEALPDGSWPIRDSEELAKAVKAVPHVEEDLRDELIDFIEERAEALDAESELPDSWS